MANYQVVDEATGCKVNVIVWDGQADLGQLYPGCRIEPDDGEPWHDDRVAAARLISRKQLLYALCEWPTGEKLTEFQTWKGGQKPQVQIYFDAEDSIPETNPKIERMCAALDVDRAALFDVALSK